MDMPVNVPVDDPNADTEWFVITPICSLLWNTLAVYDNSLERLSAYIIGTQDEPIHPRRPSHAYLITLHFRPDHI